MKLLDHIPEPAMVAAFLKAELSSERFAPELRKHMQQLGIAEAIIANPDTHNQHQNEQRAQLLGNYRGYKQNRELFKDFPDNLTWYEAELTRDDIAQLHYVDYSYWNELTGGTHLVKDAVKNIQNGTAVLGVSNERFMKVAEKIKHDERDFEPMIIYGTDAHAPFTILEGHLRATAFGLAGDEAPETVTVITGLSKAPSRLSLKTAQSAGGVVLNANGHVLIVQEYGHYWGLPRGHVEPGEGLRDAAAREVREETGITDLRYVAELGSYERSTFNKDGQDNYHELKHITFFLFTTVQTALQPHDDNITEARWIAPENATELFIHRKDKEFYEQILPRIQGEMRSEL